MTIKQHLSPFHSLSALIARQRQFLLFIVFICFFMAFMNATHVSEKNNQTRAKRTHEIHLNTIDNMNKLSVAPFAF